MSAYIVSDKHINTLVTFASRRHLTAWSGNPTRGIVVEGNEQAIAELLLAENTRSVNYRYKESEPVAPIKFARTPDLGAVSIIKACDCFDYQSCETDNYETTAAYALIKTIRDYAISELPGYDEAAWRIR